jgi:predicted enzyme related to lactoylglutathione lyase
MGEGKFYTLFKIGDQSVAGLMEVPPEMMPPNWMPYFNVADCDATVDKAKSLGAQVFMGPETMDMAGRISVMADPQGAAFGVIQPVPE